MDPFSSSLQVPDASSPGPSRSARPSSVQPTTSTSPSSSARKRASHNPAASHPQQDEQPTYRDVYAHPAALEYAAAHPRRTIPKFGPYLLLQTLGEGEFGKVKLGLHMQWGEEVAVKLIRRGNIDSSVRMGKVEREIEVLRTLKHPNIVRLYDVIETDKYIGIILEYASGGELFDHILAHRYLREKDACKLFSQLISGVWYIHQKKIVHRDLKLENLLLDRHRNVIITDFGFANRFEHRADDLMQTSCGSPCYAAPELVISDGLYVGSAVDIWSCGVILYAMLAGYLPFDDDPANPDGDNINLLYKYIVNTPLSFPDYISAEARDLLSMMLVPDPVRRADLNAVMAHDWLAPYAHTFNKGVDDLERTAMEQHHQKRLAYQKQMKQSASEISATKMSRTQSAHPGNGAPPVSGSKGHRQTHQPQPVLYEASPEQTVYSSSPQSSARRAFNSAIVLPTSPPVALDDDPFAPTPSQDVPSISLPIISAPAAEANGQGEVREEPRAGRENEIDQKPASSVVPTLAPVKQSPDAKRNKDRFRHTIQVEYGDSENQQPQPSAGPGPKRDSSSRAGERNGPSSPQQERRTSRKPTPDADALNQKPLPSPPTSSSRAPEKSAPQVHERSTAEPALQSSVSIEVTSPPATPSVPIAEKVAHVQSSSASSADSASSKKSRHKKGLSIDRMGISKIFGSGSASSVTDTEANGNMSRTSSQRSSPGRPPSVDTVTGRSDGGSRRPSTLQVPPSAVSTTASESKLLSPDGSGSGTVKNRRNTLTVMVEPFKNSVRRGPKNRVVTDTPVKEKPTPTSEKAQEFFASPVKEQKPPATPRFTNASRTDVGAGMPVPASTVKANKVMQWFRSKSKGKVPVELVDGPEKMSGSPDTESVPKDGLTVNVGAASSSSTVSNTTPGAHLGTPVSEKARSPSLAGHQQRSASAFTDTSFAGNSLADRVRKTVGIRVHNGAVDQTTITTGSPPEVMKHVRKILEDMGVEIQLESDYKYRCIRPKRKKAGGVGLGLREGGSLAAFTMVGSAASNGVDKRGLPLPSQSHSSFGSTGGMLRGLLMRRQSSQVSNTSMAHPSQSFDAETAPEAALAAAVPGGEVPSPVSIEIIYGNTQQDQGDEVRFSVELTRLDRLDDTYSLDIRRLKGNLRSYKFLYDTLRERADLQR